MQVPHYFVRVWCIVRSVTTFMCYAGASGLLRRAGGVRRSVPPDLGRPPIGSSHEFRGTRKPTDLGPRQTIKQKPDDNLFLKYSKLEKQVQTMAFGRPETPANEYIRNFAESTLRSPPASSSRTTVLSNTTQHSR